MKRVISLILSVVMLLSMLPPSAFAEEPGSTAEVSAEENNEKVSAGETSGEEQQSTSAQPLPVPVESIEILTPEDLDEDPLNDDDDIVLKPGEKLQLTAAVLPENAFVPAVVWSSADEKILKVDTRGLVEALEAGETTVRADAADESGVYGKLKITVIAPEAGVTEEKPVKEEKPATEEKPITEEKPATEEKPVTEEKPAAGEKPVTEEKPATEETPDTEEAAPSATAEEPTDRSEHKPLLERLFGKNEDEQAEDCTHEFRQGVCALCGESEEEYNKALREKQEHCDHLFGRDETCAICGLTREEYTIRQQNRCQHDFGEDGVCPLCGLTEEEYIEKRASCEHEFGEGGVCPLCGLTEAEYTAKQEHCDHEFDEGGVCPLCRLTETEYTAKQDRCVHEFDEEDICPLCGISREEYTKRVQDRCEHEFGEDGVCPLCGLSREQYEYDHRFFQSRVVDGVKITVEAPYGVFPEGAELVCAAIEDEAVSTAVDEAVDPLREDGRRVNSSYSFDIKILFRGEEIEPDLTVGKANVSFAVEQKMTGSARVNVYHVSGEAEDSKLQAEKMESDIGQLSAESRQTEEGEDSFAEGTEISIEAESFSYYVVEFTYNDKTYVMQGGSVAPLADVLNFLQIPFGEITQVSVSDETLLCAVNAEDLVTGGYQWVLISLQAFDTEEWMKVTADGKTYEITVTDASLPYDHQEITRSMYDEQLVLDSQNKSVTYTFTGNLSFRSSTKGEAIRVSDRNNYPVVMYIPYGSTVTAVGQNGSGAQPGYPAISVPEGKTLYIVGGGTLNATGGAPGNGSSGEIGYNGYVDIIVHSSCSSYERYTEWGCGRGGNGGSGGGGGGSAIGTRGGFGGSGGNGGIHKYDSIGTKNGEWHHEASGYTNDPHQWMQKTWERWAASGFDGASGSAGSSAPACGTVYAHKVTLNLQGGECSNKTNNGNGLNGSTGQKGSGDHDNDGSDHMTVGGGGGGGGGQGGLKGGKVGRGGGGGGGGAGGGSGAAMFDSGDRKNNGGNGGSPTNPRGEAGDRNKNDSGSAYPGGDGGSLGSAGASAQNNNPSSYSGIPDAVKRSFILYIDSGSEIKGTVTFSQDGEPYPTLGEGLLPADDQDGENVFLGYFTSATGGDMIYNSYGKFTGRLLEPLNFSSPDGSFPLYAHYGKAAADVRKYDSEIGRYYNEHYSSLQSAVSAAGSNETVVLRRNLDEAVSVDKDVYIDLHGHSLEYTGGNAAAITVGSSGRLRIGNEGYETVTVSSTGGGRRIGIDNRGELLTGSNITIKGYSDAAGGTGIGIYNSGSLTMGASRVVGFGGAYGFGVAYSGRCTLDISRGEIVGESSRTSGLSAPIAVESGTLTVDSNVTATLKADPEADFKAAFYAGEGGILEMRGGRWDGDTYGIVNNGGTVNFHGGTVTGHGGGKNGYGIFNQSGSLNVSGGTIIGESGKAGAVYLDTNSVYSVTGGYFIGSDSAVNKNEECSCVNVTGGYFSHELVGEGNEKVYDADSYACIELDKAEKNCRYIVLEKHKTELLEAQNRPYSGQPQKGYEYTGWGEFEEKSAKYSVNDAAKTKLSGAPTEVGSYLVTVMGLEDGKAVEGTVAFEITKRPVYVLVPDQSTVYGTPVVNIEKTVSGDFYFLDWPPFITGHTGDVVIGYTDDAGNENPADAGTYQYRISKFEVTDSTGNKVTDNYTATILDRSGRFTVEPLRLAFDTMPQKISGLVYDGANQELTTAGTVKGGIGEVRYAVVPGDTATEPENYSRSAPVALNAGTYTVFARVFPPQGSKSSNYIVSELYRDTVTIEKAEADFSFTETPETTVSLSLNGTPRTADRKLLCSSRNMKFKGVSVSGSIYYNGEVYRELNNVTALDGLDGFKTLFKGQYAGEYTYNFKVVPRDNYCFADGQTEISVSGKVIMKGAKIAASEDPDEQSDFEGLSCSGTYGDTLAQFPLTYTNRTDGTGKVILDGELTWDEPETVVREGGKYSFTYTPGEVSAKTFATTAGLSYTIQDAQIAPRPVYIQWDSDVFYYDVKDHRPTASITNLVSGDTCKPTVTIYDSRGNEVTGTVSAIGVYKAVVTRLSDEKHYTLENGQSLELTFRIVNVDETAILAPEVYAARDGNGHSIKVLNVPGDAKILYSEDGSSWREANYAYTDIGDYPVWYKVTFEGIPEGKTEPETITKTGSSAVHIYEGDIPVIVPPELESRTYNGTDQSFLKEEVSAGEGVKLVYSIYPKNEFPGSFGPFSESAPTARYAGVYYIAYRLESESGEPLTTLTMRTDIQMLPAELTLEWNNDTEFSYDCAEHHPTLRSDVQPFPGDSFTVSGETDAGTHHARVSIHNGSRDVTDCYDLTGNDREYTIKKAAVSGVTYPTAITAVELPAELKNGVIITDSRTAWDFDLIVPGSIVGGRFEYSVNGGPYSSRIPTASQRGSYEIKYKIVPDKNHETMDTQEHTLTQVIKFRTFPAVPAAVQGLVYTYDASAGTGILHKLIDAGDMSELEGGTMLYSLNGEDWFSDADDIIAAEPGEYTISYKVKADESRFYITTDEPGSVSTAIARRSVSVSALTVDKIYDGKCDVDEQAVYSEAGVRFTAKITGVTDDPNVTISGSPINILSAALSLPDEADRAHYDVTLSPFRRLYVNILPREAQLRWDGLSRDYDGTSYAPSAAVTNLAAGDECTVNVSGQQINANAVNGICVEGKTPYVAYAASLSNRNYTVSGDNPTGRTEFLINKIAPLYTAPAAKEELLYNGQSQALVTSGSTGHGTILFSLDGADYTEKVPTANDFEVDHVILWQLVGDENHLDIAPEELTVRIEKGLVRIITPPAAAPGLIYSGSAQTLASGGSAEKGTILFSMGDVQPDTDDQTAWSRSVPTGTEAGDYKIWWYVKGDTGYRDTSAESFTARIEKAPVHVLTAPVPMLGLMYNAAPQPLALAGETETAQGSIVYSLSEEGPWSGTIPTAADAGSYSVWWRTEPATDNYATGVPQAFSTAIATKPVSLIWSDTQKVYTGQTLLPAAEVCEVCQGDDCTAIVSCDRPSVNVGAYTATAQLGGEKAANYSLAENICAFIIEPALPTATAPEALTTIYNGEYQTILNPGSSADGTIMYSDDGKNWKSTLLTEKHAGSYSIFWFVVGDANHRDSAVYELAEKTVISPRPVSLLWREDSFAYTGRSCCPEAAAADLLPGDQCSVLVEGGGINVGEYTARAVSLDNGDYALPADPTHTFVIEKSEPKVILPTIPDNLVYTGEPMVLINPGSTEDGTIQYSLTALKNDWHEGVETITGTDAGEYTVYVRVLGDENHTDILVDEEGQTPHATVTIAKAASYLLKAPAAVSGLVYDGTPKTLVVDGLSSTGEVEYSFDGVEWLTGLPQGTNAGSYTLFCRAKADNNHDASGIIAVSDAMIAKAKPNVGQITASAILYGDSLAASRLTGTAPDGTITWKDPSFVPEDAGTARCTAVYTPADADNYSDVQLSVELTVLPRTIDIEWPQADSQGNISLPYNGRAQVPEARAAGLVRGDECELTVMGASGALPGSYTARVTAVSDTNYALPAVTERNYTIVPAVMTDVIVNDVNVAYDGKWHTIEIRNAPDGAVTEYSTDGVNYYSVAPMFRDFCVGQSVWYRISCTGYTTLEGRALVTISSEPIITKKPRSATGLIYNGREKTLCSRAELSSGTVQYSLDGVNWSDDVPTAVNAGAYRIYYRAERTMDGVTDTESGSIIAGITSRRLTATWENTEFDYDGTAKCPTLTLSGVLEEDGDVSATVTGAAVKAGVHTARITALSNQNYAVTNDITVSFTIHKAQAEFTPPVAIDGLVADRQAKDIVLPGSTPHGTILYASLIYPDVWSTDVPRAVEAGQYIVSYRIDCDENHYDNGPHSLTARLCYGQAQAIEPPKAEKCMYTGQPQTLCTPAVTNEGTVWYSLDKEQWALSVPEGTDAGDYTVYWYIRGDDMHLDSPVLSVETVIEKAPCTVTVYPEAKAGLVYDGQPHELITAGQAEGGELVYTCRALGIGNETAVPSGISAGEYEISWYVRADGNHEDSSVFTVNAGVAKAVCSDKGSFSATAITYGDSLAGSLIFYVKDGTMTWKTPGSMPYAGTASYTAIFTPNDARNYLTEEVEVPVTVRRRTAELVWDESSLSLIYNGQKQTPSATVGNLVDGDECRVTVEGGATGVGSYTASVAALSNENYTLGTTSVKHSYSILPGNMNISAEDVLIPYTAGDDNLYSITVKGMPEGASVYYSLNHVNYSRVNPVFAGKADEDVGATVYYKVTHPDYNTFTGSARVLIYAGKIASADPAPAAVKNLVYTGEQQALVIPGTVADPATMCLEYALKDEKGVVSSFSAELPSGTDAGSYTVCYRIRSTQPTEGVPLEERVHDSPVYELRVSIAPRPVGVTWQKSAADDSTSLVYPYDGRPHLPYAFAGGVDDRILTASVKGTAQAVAPGEYTAEATGFADSNYTVSQTGRQTAFIIGRNAVDDITPPVPREGLVYNGLYQPLAVSGSSSQGTVLYSLTGREDDFSHQMPEGLHAGGYTLWYYVQGDSFHADSEVRSIKCAIAPAQSSIVTAPTPVSDLVYNGREQLLVNAGSAFGGTLVYSLNGTDYSTVLPTAENAGSYTVYYKVVGDTDYADTPVKSLNVSVGRLGSSMIAPAAVEGLVYTGQAQKLITPGASSDGKMKYSLDGIAWTENAGEITGIDAGRYSVLYYAAGTGNYKDSAVGSVSVLIEPGENGYIGDITATPIHYGESLSASKLEGAVSGEVFWLISDIVPPHAGTDQYNAVYMPDNDNLKPILMSVSVETLPRSAAIEWGEESLHYNGSALVRQAQVTNLLKGDSCDVIVKGEKILPGIYEAEITGLSDPDYVLPDTSRTAPFTILGDAVMEGVYAPDVYAKYDGNGHGIEVRNAPESARIYYSMDGEPFTDRSPARIEPGVSKVTYRVQCEGYIDFTADAEITVYPADAPDFRVTAPEGVPGLVYNGAKQILVTPGSAVAVSADGKETEAVMLYAVPDRSGKSVELNVTTTLPEAAEAGEYTVFFMAYDPATDTTSALSGIEVSIAPRELHLTWGEHSWKYDGEKHLPTVTADNIRPGDTCLITVEGAAESVGVHTATATAVSNANYCLGEGTQQEFTIEKAEPFCVLPSAVPGLVYNGTEQPLIMPGLIIEGEDFTYSLDGEHYSPALPAGVNAGDYTVSYRLAPSESYLGVEGSIPVNIAKAAGSVKNKPVPMETLVYDGNEKALVSAGSSDSGAMGYSTDGENFLPAVPVAVDAGGYTVYFRSEESGNYSASEPESVRVTVAKAQSGTGHISAAAITYGQSLSESTLVMEGNTTEGSVSWKYPDFKPNAGSESYTAVFTPENSNYDSADIEVTVSVLPMEAEIVWGEKTLAYTGKAIAPAAAVTGLPEGDDCAVRLTEDSYQILPGSYTAEVASLENGNYTLREAASTPYTITKADFTGIFADDITAEYAEGSGRSIRVCGVPADAEITYSLDGSTYTADNPVITGTEGQTTKTTVYYKVSREYYNDFTGSAKITILSSAKAPLEVTAPTARTGLAFDGTRQQLVDAGSAHREGSSTALTAEYALAGSAKPVWREDAAQIRAGDAGTYRVLYRFSENGTVVYTGSVDSIIIAPLTAELEWFSSSDAKDTDLEYIYDGQAHVPFARLANSYGDEPSTVTVTGSASKPGEYTARAVSLSSGNYVLGGDTTAAFTVKKAAPAFAAPQSVSAVWTGNAIALARPGTTGDGTFLYSLNGSDWNESVPTGTKAESYTVYYKVIGDSTHGDSEKFSFISTIEKAAARVLTAPAAAGGLVYTGEALSLIDSSIRGTADTAMEYRLDGDWSGTLPRAAEIGTYTVLYRAKADENRDASQAQSLTVAIAAAAPVVPAMTASLTYGDALAAAEILGVSGGTARWADANIVPDSAGEKTCKAVFTPDDSHYAAVTADVKVTVAERTAVLTWGRDSFSYNGRPQVREAFVENLLPGDECTVTVTGAQTAPGTGYTATAVSLDNDNYILGSDDLSASFTITPDGAMKNVYVPNVSAVYDGNAHGLTVHGAPAGYTVLYSADGGAYTDDYRGRTEVGVSVVDYIISCEGYTDLSGTATVTVYPANYPRFTVTAPEADPALTEYDGSYQTLITAGRATYVSDGETVTAAMQYALLSPDSREGQIRFTENLPTAREAGTYTVLYRALDKQTGAVSDCGTLDVTLSPRTLALVWDGTEWDYDGQNHLPTAKGSNIVSGDSCAVTVMGAAKTVGTHTAAAADVSNPNYRLPGEYTQQFTINRAAPAFTAPAAAEGLHYNGAAQTLVEPGKTGDGELLYRLNDGAYSQALPAVTNAGTYTVSWYLAGDATHADTAPQSLTVTVEKAPGAIKALPMPLDPVYDGTQRELISAGEAAQGSMEYSFDGISWSDSIPAVTEAGSYNVYCRSRADSNHLPSEIACVSASVARAVPEDVSVTAASITYGSPLSSAALTLGGAGSKGTVRWKDPGFLPAAGSGSYTAVFTPADSRNYLEREIDAALTVEPRTVKLHWSGLTAEYTGSSLAPSVSVTNLIGADECDVSVNCADGDMIVPRTYPVRAEALSNSNYTLENASDKAASFIITAADMKDVYADDVTAEYVPGVTRQIEVHAPAGAQISYSLDGRTYTQDNPGIVGEPDSTVTVTVFYRVTKQYYTDFSGSAEITVVPGAKPEFVCTPPEYAGKLYYTGEERPLIRAGSAARSTGAALTMEYSLDGSRWSADAGQITIKDAGSYRVRYRVLDEGTVIGTGSLDEIMVQPMTLLVRWLPVQGEELRSSIVYDYDGAIHCPYAELIGMVEGDECTAQVAGAAREAGLHTASVTALTNPNYTVREDTASVSFSIVMQQPEYTAPKPRSLVYAHSDIPLVEPGTTSDGTFLYSMNESGPWSESIPTGRDTGKYTVYYMVRGDHAHADSPVGNVTVFIDRSTGHITAKPVGADNVFNGLAQSLLSFAGTADPFPEYSLNGSDWSREVPAADAIGSYTVWVRAGKDANYNASAPESVQASISPKPYEFTGTATALLTYGEALGKAAITITGDDNVQAAWLDGNIVPESAGDRTYKARLTPKDPHYGSVIVDVAVSVAPRKAQIAWGETTLEYTGEPIAPAASVKNLLPGDECTVTVSGQATDSGSYTAAAEALSSASYALPEPKPATAFSIVNQTMENITAGNVIVRYDGESHSIQVSGAPAGAVITYSTDGNVYSDVNPGFTQIGSYNVYFRITADGYRTYRGSAGVTILSEEVPEIHIEAPVTRALTYNGTYQTAANPGSAWYESKGVRCDMKMMYLLTRDPSEVDPASEMSSVLPTVRDAGTYTLLYMALDTVGGFASDVYSKELTVNPAQVVLLWGETRVFPYDGKPHAPTATAAGLYGADECPVTVTGAVSAIGENYTASAEISNPNYVLPAKNTVEFSISKGYIDPEAKTGLVYTGQPQSLLAAPGTAQAGNMIYSLDGIDWSTQIPVATKAGNYTVHFSTDIEGSPRGSVEVSIDRAPAEKVSTTDWLLGNSGKHRFTCTIPYSSDAVFLIDGKIVDRQYCTLSSGSTVAEVSPEFMNRLSVGEHSFTFRYDNYYPSSGTFRVRTINQVKTGDDSHVELYAISAAGSAALALAVIVLLGKYRKKAKQQ